MRCLVTGGAGFVGSALIRDLVRVSERVISLDSYESGSVANHVPGVTYLRGSTAAWDAHQELVDFAPTHVFHFGEFSRIVPSFDDPELVLESNLTGTHRIVMYALRKGAKLVYSGSSAIFGDSMRDQHLNPYAWTKAKNVELIRNFGEWFGLKYAIAYFYNVYGPGQISTGAYATVIGVFERQFREQRPLTVVEPGTQTRAFTHISDIVAGLRLVAERGDGDGYFLGTETNVAILDVVAMFESDFVMVPERRGERLSSQINASRAREELAWAPRVDLASYVAEVRARCSKA